MEPARTSSANCFYIYTYFEHHISMNVKSDLPRIDKLRQIMEGRQGLLLRLTWLRFILVFDAMSPVCI
jgi:hypothetical protein